MPEIPSDALPFARVLAIAVQGVWDVAPQRTRSSIEVSNYISASLWMGTLGPHAKIVVDSLGGRKGIYVYMPEFHVRSAKLQGKASTARWLVQDVRLSKEGVAATQDEVERLVATFFTAPYPVQRVSDEAENMAKWMYAYEAGWAQ